MARWWRNCCAMAETTRNPSLYRGRGGERMGCLNYDHGPACHRIYSDTSKDVLVCIDVAVVETLPRRREVKQRLAALAGTPTRCLPLIKLTGAFSFMSQ